MNDFINKKNSLRNLSDEEFETVVKTLSEELDSNGFIYDNFDDLTLRKDWTSLCKKDVKDLTSISATCTVGMKIIKHYMRHFYSVKNYKNISVLSLWNKQNLEKALRFNRKYHSTPYVSEIIRSLSFTNGLGKITIYRPVMAKIICNHFKVKSVLDVCVGWGGRMLGVKSLKDISYTGIEPYTATYNKLCDIRTLLSLEDVTLINKPAEIALNELPDDLKFDLALTSPPYYNLEIYSEEPTQSLQHGSYKSWIKNFLEPVIKNVISRVTYSCWSVKNFKTDKKYDLLDDIIAIHKENGWIMSDTIFTMKNSKRPGKTSIDDVKKTEENTYVFVKA